MPRPLFRSYEQRLGWFPDRWHRFGAALLLTAALLLLTTGSPRLLSLANLSLIAVVGATGLQIVTGFAGQVSLGHAAFLALGAYTAGILAERFAAPFFLLLPAGGAVAALVGAAVGGFSLRLRGLYLAIVTLGLTFIVNHFLLTLPALTHGLSGMAVTSYVWFRVPISADAFEPTLFVIFAGVALLAVLLLSQLRRSAPGRAMMAVRDHDIAAAALGIQPARVKIAAFTLGSFLAGTAGVMLAMQQQYLTVNPPFNLELSVDYIAMIVLGGVGTTFGAVSGAIFYTAAKPFLSDLAAHLPLLGTLSSAQRGTVLFAIFVLLLLRFEPLGLTGWWLRIKRYFAAWPFRY